MTSTTLNRFYIAAAIVTAVTTLGHAIGGELSTIRALIESGIPLNFQVELRAVWHGYTVMLAGSTWLLYRMARRAPMMPELKWGLALFFLIGGFVWLQIVVLMGFENLIGTPQWLLLLLIGSLTAAGNRATS